MDLRSVWDQGIVGLFHGHSSSRSVKREPGEIPGLPRSGKQVRTPKLETTLVVRATGKSGQVG